MTMKIPPSKMLELSRGPVMRSWLQGKLSKFVANRQIQPPLPILLLGFVWWLLLNLVQTLLEFTTEVHPAGDAEDKVSDDVNDSDDKTKDAEKAKDENTKQSESKTDEVEDKSTGDKEDSLEKEDPTNTAHKEDAADKDSDNPSEANKTETDNEQTKDGDKTENLDNEENKVATEEQTAEGGPLKSFQQLSSSQNAFTGLSGSGFSFGTSLGNGSSSIFGLKSDKPFGLTLPTNGNSSIFVASGASTVSKSEGSGLPTMQEVAVETGEENETVVFTADSVLFEYVDGGWKERGKGELKVNVTATGTDRARLLMRARGNYRLILNASLYPDMKLTNMDKKGVTFACVNSASEGKDGLSTFALKFKDNSIMEEFRATVVAHKDKTSTAQKTPENSPEASGD
ncbi:Nuclear pore complex protein NUP50A [Quillaja saponaria]|uniref:Nuclear pore complex protein NUP50A n=1 Tax=Quillaja saponaria TaxID=32244 RepID=A0AAD7LRD8_QUISA|nr:Nuclear pore complex protein NUP50A [Quillaja saponaria]